MHVDQWSAAHKCVRLGDDFQKYRLCDSNATNIQTTVWQWGHRTVHDGYHQELGADVSNHSFCKKRKTRGTVRTVRTTKNTERVRTAVGPSPKRSAYRHSVTRNISRRSLRRILQSDLHFHPFKRHIVKKLSDPDFASRSAFYLQFVTLMNEHLYIIRRLIMPYEGRFELCSYVKCA